MSMQRYASVRNYIATFGTRWRVEVTPEVRYGRRSDFAHTSRFPFLHSSFFFFVKLVFFSFCFRGMFMTEQTLKLVLYVLADGKITKYNNSVYRTEGAQCH